MTGSVFRFVKTFAFLFLMPWAFPLAAQDSTYFSRVPEELFEQMETFFDLSNRKELKKQRKALEDKLDMGLIEEDNFATLVDMLNAMKERKLNAWPYFYDYLKAAQTILICENGNTEYRKWQSAIEAAMKAVENNRYKRFNDLLEFSHQFYETGYIVSSRAGASWRVDDRSPEFGFDEEGEFLVQFEDIHLSASRKEDSLVIVNTSGAFRPEDKHWLGEGGKVTWWRYGQDGVYCELSSYDIDLKRPIFEIKDVNFVHPELFPGETLTGTLKEKVYQADEDGEGDYPKFDGVGDQVDLTRLIDNVALIGGFSLHGTTIYVSGGKGSRAKLIVEDKSRRDAMRAIAPRFKVSKDRVYSRSASLVIYMAEADSLVHPSVSLDYKPSTGALDIGKGEGLQANSPFFDSYHGFSFSASELQYRMESDSIVLGRKRLGLGKVNKEIIFESPNFFDYGQYLRAQNIGRVNPLARLNKLAVETGDRKFNLATVIDQINPQLTPQSIQTLLSDLVKQGFINYNATKREVIVKDKLLHYAEAALNNTDYDKMRLVSASPDENGVLDLDNMELLLGGVENVVLSDSQKVAMKPYFSEVTLLEENRIRMHGKLYAGYTTFEGLEFYYDYPEHKVYLDSVKEFQLYIPTGRLMEGGQQEAVSVNSMIESMKAVLIIDAPHNKASLVDIPLFPSMHTRGSSYVFYDENSIHGGVYTRDSFYFQLDEFDLESLDKLDSTEISFSGTLHSKDIMETFQDSLILREDRSLGLLSNTPEEGRSLYRDKGRFAGQIDLSNRGFYGDGELTYLKASVNSEDVLFKPKQLTGTADVFELEGDSAEGNELPKVKGIDVSLDWRPYVDSMYIRSAEAPFQMYEKGLHQFKGALIYTPGGLKGDGLLDWSKGAVRSKLLSFGYDNARADTLNLVIKAVKGEALAFDSRDQSGFLDFSENFGEFEGNSDQTNTNMPANQFKTNLNDFDWDMEENLVIFKDPEGSKGLFIATHPDMDSLDFYGEKAQYDLDENVLLVKGVESVASADALIYPEDGQVIVREQGQIDSFYNALIVADTISRYHEIERATVKIKGKKDYTASGYYQYNIAGREQEILFDNIIGERVGKGSRSEKRTETRASGIVKEEDGFFIDYKTQFKGAIQLKAGQQALRFKGFARFDMSGLRNDSTWFSVDFIGDKNNLILQYDSPKTFEGYPVETGVFINKESAFVYPAVMNSLYSRQDRPIIDMSGVADYDPDKDQLIMGDSAVVLGDAVRGNSMKFQCETGDLEAKGRINLCDESELVEIEAYGVVNTRDGGITYDSLGFAQSASETTLDAMPGLILHIPNPLLKFIVKDLSTSIAGALRSNYNDSYYDEVAPNFIEDPVELKKFREQLLLGNMVVPDDYNPYDILFGKLEMKWIPNYQSFITTKKNNPVISIDQLGIHKKLESYVEFIMPSNGNDRVYCYIEMPNGNYYFFGLKDGLLYTVSNNFEYNDKVDDLKKKNRVIKLDKGLKLEVVLSDVGTAKRFVSRVKDVQ